MGFNSENVEWRSHWSQWPCSQLLQLRTAGLLRSMELHLRQCFGLDTGVASPCSGSLWWVAVTFSRDLMDLMHIYRPQRSWGKVMFLHVCVILFRVGGLPQCMLGYPLGAGTPREQEPPLGADPPWRPAARHAGIAPLLRSACWEKRSTSGRYASHWNAILVMDVVSRWHPDKYNLF